VRWCSIGRWLGARGACVALLVVCTACGGDGTGTGAAAPAFERAGDGAADAGDAFGNPPPAPGAQNPFLTLIDDGGAGMLPDGAVVYLALRSRPCPANSDLTYATFGSAFVQSYCLRCHSEGLSGMARGGAPVGVNFDALEAIRMRADSIWRLAADDHMYMPENGAAPSPDERHLLGDWLACGAP